MQFIQNFLLGLKAYYKAVKFIIAHKFYWYLIIPAFLMLIIYKLGELIQKNYSTPNVQNMNDTVWYLIYLLLEISVAILLMKFAKYLVVIILSPLLSQLSMKTERILTGNVYPFSMSQLIQDVKRATKIVVRNLMWEYFFFLIILIVSFLGWENPTSSPVFYVTFVIGFFYYGFAFMDYINERRRLNIDDSIIFVRKNRGLAISLGCIYSLLILVPLEVGGLFDFSNFSSDPINTLSTFLLQMLLWLCASSAPILAIVAATIAMDDLVDLKSNEYCQKTNEL